MKKWHIKAVIQGLLSIMPFSHRLNYLLQRYVTKGIQVNEDEILLKLAWCATHLDYYRTVSQTDHAPGTVLELGSGWIPAVPLGLFLSGVDHVYSIDINRLMTVQTLTETMQSMANLARSNHLEATLPVLCDDRVALLEEVLAEHTAEPMTLDAILARLNIACMVGDARATDFAENTFDLILSNATLEHISRPILVDIFKEFQRIIKMDGVMSHLIDMRDHYAYFDRHISELNYLRFEEQTWRWFNTALHYQNRLRCSDYHQVHQETGFTIVREKDTTSDPGQLANMPLAEQYLHYAQADLLVSSAWMIAQPEVMAAI